MQRLDETLKLHGIIFLTGHLDHGKELLNGDGLRYGL
jgi:hypothetical protein